MKRISTWAVRLLYVLTFLVYLFAAISLLPGNVLPNGFFMVFAAVTVWLLLRAMLSPLSASLSTQTSAENSDEPSTVPASGKVLAMTGRPHTATIERGEPEWHRGLQHTGDQVNEGGGCEYCNPPFDASLERVAALVAEHWEGRRWNLIDPTTQEAYREHARTVLAVPVLLEALRPLLADADEFAAGQGWTR